MKTIVMAAVVAAGLAAAGAANADGDEKAKAAGCMNCHAVDTKKLGPAFKEVAAKYKGKAGAEKDLIAKIGGAKGHPEVKAKGDDLKEIIEWVLKR
jgi:cytochrome c